ncbi:hypothetical protein KFL_005000030 [Klebsormidium nitens]|uniref:Uncharacterized protein n=1 Tax=Klebsormidium nitens TaxID=105231 RepID=A0A1Y1IKD5_KLENI|nr:hypothetical protein KFL_005000030 [Klebsormidium nitens]|eukprot:GAQ89226.1 hypothetical protein KFL_005000030 [Klebsormidium nitens]
MDPPKFDPGALEAPPTTQVRKDLGFWKRFFRQKEAVTGLVLTSACLFLSLRIMNDKKRIEAGTAEWEKVNKEVESRREESARLAEENRGLRTALDGLRERVLNEVRMNGRKLPPLEARVGTVFAEAESKSQVAVPEGRETENTGQESRQLTKSKKGFFV